MKTQLDLRSMLIGILMTVCFTFAIGASRSDSSTSRGRFQLCLPGEGSHAYVIDTTTGEVWSKLPIDIEDANNALENAKNFRKPKL